MARRANALPGQRTTAPKNVSCRIDITIKNQTAIFAGLFPHTHWHCLPASADAAIHAGAAEINLDNLATGTFSLADQLMCKLFPLPLGD